MQRHSVDIFISGGGIAGLSAAAAFGQAGFTVLLADPAPAITDGATKGADLRSTAFLAPARKLFETIGIWDALDAQKVPLCGLRIVDLAPAIAPDAMPELRDSRLFRAEHMDQEAFGWNFLNWVVRREILATLSKPAYAARVDLRFGVGFSHLVNRTNAALIRLSDGTQVEAKLAIAADGRDSPLRAAAGIQTRLTRYGQMALAFSASHDVPHDDISTEIYLDGGPFTLVPLADVDGKPASAVVWMNKTPRARALNALPTDEFNDEMTRRSGGLMGDMRLISGRAGFDIINQRARELTAGRVALMAEAAHVLPPIGAQGLNTSLNDLAALYDLACADPGGIGGPDMMAAYEKARARDIAARAVMIDVFNRVTRAPESPLQDLRQLGLRLAHDVKPLRQGLMRFGMGPL